MNTRPGFLVVFGLLLLVGAVAGGWWLASGGGEPATKVSVSPTKPMNKPATISPIPLQPVSPIAGTTPEVSATTDGLKPKFEERDLPPAEDIAKFLNGESDSSVKK